MNVIKFTKSAWVRLLGLLIVCLMLAGLLLAQAPAIALSDGLVVTRTLPDTVEAGETFDVTVTFTASADDFTAAFEDYAPDVPSNWVVTANAAWCTPSGGTVSPVGNQFGITWLASFDEGTSFTLLYKVTVPGAATPGTYDFVNGQLGYSIEGGAITYVDVPDDSVEVVEPDISVSPTTLAFGNVGEGSSKTMTLTISNEGGADLSITSIDKSGPDAAEFARGPYTGTIAADSSATVDVTFSPESTGDKSATLTIASNDPDEPALNVTLEGTGAAAGAAIQVAFLLDSSGSIGSSNWNIIVNGLADAVEDSECVPQDGSVELTVVRFSSSADVPVGPVVITSANAASTASDIRAISFTGGGTCISCSFDAASTALAGSPNFSPSLKQAINLVTDGEPNSASASEAARDNCITTLQMTESQDAICSEAIGSGPNVDWLRDEIVFPQPGCEWDGVTSPLCSGWVRQVADIEEFVPTVCEKLKAIIAEPPVCDFTATPLTGLAALTVQFTDLSTGEIDSWAWDFDNDGVTDSTQQHPSHTYTIAGTYTVSMTATGPGGFCTETKVAYITVQELPTEEEEPANLVAAYLLISPEQVAPNQQVEISINIGNDGGATGTRSIALYINGVLEQSQTVSVSPGSAKNVVFTVTKTAPGTYQVMLEGNVGQFTVMGTADGNWGGPLGTGGIIAIVVFVIALVVALVFILRRE